MNREYFVTADITKHPFKKRTSKTNWFYFEIISTAYSEMRSKRNSIFSKCSKHKDVLG